MGLRPEVAIQPEEVRSELEGRILGQAFHCLRGPGFGRKRKLDACASRRTSSRAGGIRSDGVRG